MVSAVCRLAASADMIDNNGLHHLPGYPSPYLQTDGVDSDPLSDFPKGVSFRLGAQRLLFVALKS